MKFRMLLGSFLVTAFFVVTFVSYSCAAGWNTGTCTVHHVTSMSTQNTIVATCPDAGYTDQFFRVSEASIKNQLLAMLLTAISSGAEVRLWIEDDGKTVTRVRVVGN